MSKKQSTRKLVATALGALATGIAAPAIAQDAPVTQTPPVVTAPTPAPTPVVEAPAAAPVVQTPAPEPFQLKVPELDPVPATPRREAATPTAPRAATAAPKRATPVRTVPPVTATNNANPVAQPATAAPTVPSAPVVAAPIAPAPAPRATAPTAPSETDPDWMLIGGAAGAGLLGLAGVAGLAMRRRREEIEPEAVEPLPQSVAPVAVREPVTPAPVAAPILAERGTVGRHEAAALVGPTAENPFLTRRARMRHARFLDRREALAAAPAAARLVEHGETAPVEQRQPDEAKQVTYSFGKADRRFGFGAPVLR